MHVHQNVPGVLRDVNRVIGDANANIHAQLLSTNPDIGYLVMDLDSSVSAQVTKALLELPTTIKARALS
jgi:D-3-phosphoglycerate dehydrogenase